MSGLPAEIFLAINRWLFLSAQVSKPWSTFRCTFPALSSFKWALSTLEGWKIRACSHLLCRTVFHIQQKLLQLFNFIYTWNVFIIRSSRSNLILRKKDWNIPCEKVLLNARINSFYHLILLENKRINLHNETMIMKKVKPLYFSRLSWPQKNTQAVCCLLQSADVFLKTRLFQRGVKSHSKNNPSWLWYMFYNNIKLLSTRN